MWLVTFKSFDFLSLHSLNCACSRQLCILSIPFDVYIIVQALSICMPSIIRLGNQDGILIL